jgi:nitrate/TMAO reductase-like tetraheme cytochrome c subunit
MPSCGYRRDFKPVSHNFPLSHIHDRPRTSIRGAPASVTSGASRAFLFSFLFLFVVVDLVPGQAPQQAADKSAQSASAPTSEVSKYVGPETCKTCHEEIYNSWEKSPHWKTTLNKEAGPSKQGCEACHGPGAEHVEGGGDKTKIFVFEDHSRQETSARCLTCHGEGHEQAHFSESAHSSSNVGCLDCHSPHHGKEKLHLHCETEFQSCGIWQVPRI